MARRTQGIRYEPDFAGLGHVMRSHEMRAMLERRALAGKRFAESIAPRDTGDYASSFRVESSARGTGRWSDRAEARLINGSSHAALVEYANDDRVLGRAVDVIERG